ncbi:mechanosensitive ion channel family protein [uncultured Algimonas sp.]|uniref:mechanosensitive ion channel family protein n=1 Tax=uncultured Algimonas sp. TaxID=1547920 RepID=UPI0026336020|nr:mechanosensitive ion channel family protein [uncultured Algimonas sp.]
MKSEPQDAEQVATERPDVTGQVDANPSLFTEKLDGWLDALTYALPNLAFALVLLLLAWLLGKGVDALVRRRLAARNREDLGQLMGSLLKWGLIAGALAFGATLVFPSLMPADLFAGLGLGSVAVGFAFKDILQNWLAGLLLLVRRPFEPGDQIEVGDFEGTVQHIETRSTMIRTYDGQRVVIPNSEVYGDAVLVKTNADLRRSEVDFEVGFKESVGDLREMLMAAMQGADGVVAEPAPDVLSWNMQATALVIRCRWWSRAFRADVVETRARVIEALHDTLIEHGVSRPLEVEVHLDGKAGAADIPIGLRGETPNRSR